MQKQFPLSVAQTVTGRQARPWGLHYREALIPGRNPGGYINPQRQLHNGQSNVLSYLTPIPSGHSLRLPTWCASPWPHLQQRYLQKEGTVERGPKEHMTRAVAKSKVLTKTGDNSY